MGIFSVPIQIVGPTGRTVEVEAIVDTGATRTLVPRTILVGLGVEPLEQISFQLADDRIQEYYVGEARVRIDGRERTTVVIFGPEGIESLLGATTLELFNLAVDPVRQRLLPVPGLLKPILDFRLPILD